MNQAYQHAIVNKLLALSDHLVAEDDPKSAEYWERHMDFIYDRVKSIESDIRKKKGPSKTAYQFDSYVDPWLIRQMYFADLLATDPFVPRDIREPVSKFYSKRVDVMSIIYAEYMRHLCKKLINKTFKSRFPSLAMNTWVELGKRYEAKGFGWTTTRETRIQFRRSIEEYLINLK